MPACLPGIISQASQYQAGAVVKTLKKAFLPDGVTTTLTFQNEDEVRADRDWNDAASLGAAHYKSHKMTWRRGDQPA
jgi:hypothetical protein